MKLSKGWLALIVILAVIIADQALKIWVKTHFYLGEDFRITSWFQLLFIENDGMAFGMKMGSKLFLSLFRIVLAGLLIWVIVKLKDRPEVKRGFLVCIALITAGAAGNIIDCLFYGLIFNNPPVPEVAVLFPAVQLRVALVDAVGWRTRVPVFSAGVQYCRCGYYRGCACDAHILFQESFRADVGPRTHRQGSRRGRITFITEIHDIY